MKYDVISADGHVDLIWLPPDLFTKNASAALKDRMPHVIDGPKGPEWVSAKGARFGLVNGMGSAGREYVPGVIHRSDRMASTGLFDDGKKGIRRLTDPALRLQDQDRDGVGVGIPAHGRMDRGGIDAGLGHLRQQLLGGVRRDLAMAAARRDGGLRPDVDLRVDDLHVNLKSQPIHFARPRPMTFSRSWPFSQGSSSVKSVMHWR